MLGVATVGSAYSAAVAVQYRSFKSSNLQRQCLIRASSAASTIDLTTLQSAIDKKDSNAVKDVLDQLREAGWAKKWSSQPYVSRRTVSLQCHRSKPKLGNDQQQNLTRWAVLFCGSLLKNNESIHEALIKAMSEKASVIECFEAIEKAA